MSGSDYKQTYFGMDSSKLSKGELIALHLQSPIQVGDSVNYTTKYSKNPTTCKVVEVLSDDKFVIRYDGRRETVDRSELTKATYDIGANPFAADHGLTKSVAYNLGSILFSLDLLNEAKRKSGTDYKINDIVVKEVTFDPYVIDVTGQKVYFQRPLVWTLEDKQALIDSIYNDVYCGSVLVRKLEWDDVELRANRGDTDLAFHEVIDGKQRLHTLYEFVNSKFPDSYGNYWDDLSDSAQHKFNNSSALTYSYLDSTASDAMVIRQFLKVNFAGVPQSKEHIDFIKSIQF